MHQHQGFHLQTPNVNMPVSSCIILWEGGEETALSRQITWYATSKKGIWFFSSITSAIFSHCSGVGSIPVGLWAQPCRRIKDPSGAAYVMHSFIKTLWLETNHFFRGMRIVYLNKSIVYNINQKTETNHAVKALF